MVVHKTFIQTLQRFALDLPAESTYRCNRQLCKCCFAGVYKFL